MSVVVMLSSWFGVGVWGTDACHNTTGAACTTCAQHPSARACRMILWTSSIDCVPSIDDKCMSLNERRLRRTQEQHRISNFLRRSHSLHRSDVNRRLQRFSHFFRSRSHRRPDNSRTNAVDTNVVFRVIYRVRTGHINDRGLGSTVRGCDYDMDLALSIGENSWEIKKLDLPAPGLATTPSWLAMLTIEPRCFGCASRGSCFNMQRSCARQLSHEPR